MERKTDGHAHCIHFKVGILGLVKHMVVLNLGYVMHNVLTNVFIIEEMLWYNLIEDIAKNQI